MWMVKNLKYQNHLSNENTSSARIFHKYLLERYDVLIRKIRLTSIRNIYCASVRWNYVLTKCKLPYLLNYRWTGTIWMCRLFADRATTISKDDRRRKIRNPKREKTVERIKTKPTNDNWHTFPAKPRRKEKGKKPVGKSTRNGPLRLPAWLGHRRIVPWRSPRPQQQPATSLGPLAVVRGRVVTRRSTVVVTCPLLLLSYLTRCPAIIFNLFSLRTLKEKNETQLDFIGPVPVRGRPHRYGTP